MASCGKSTPSSCYSLLIREPQKGKDKGAKGHYWETLGRKTKLLPHCKRCSGFFAAGRHEGIRNPALDGSENSVGRIRLQRLHRGLGFSVWNYYTGSIRALFESSIRGLLLIQGFLAPAASSKTDITARLQKILGGVESLG